MGIERIVFFGTPQFAVPALEALVAAGRPPVLVVTQPPRPAGRGRRLVEPPVLRRARELGLPAEAVEKVKAPEFLARLAALAPDLGVVVAFGQIFPAALLALPRLGCLNLHASLLPRWRGAAPIAAAIAAGDDETGVAIQQMESGLDSGPVLASSATRIGAAETTEELSVRLAALGAELLVEVVAAIEQGRSTPVPQNESAVTWAPKLVGRRRLPLGEGAGAAAREVRAYGGEPGVVVSLAGEEIKVLAARAVDDVTAPAGRIVGVAGEALRVGAAGGAPLDLLRLQRPGGRPVSGRDLANGLRLAAGMPVA